MHIIKLLERIDNVFYHATYAHSALEILKTNRLKLTSSIGTPTDNNLRGGKAPPYYLSLTRSKVGNYHVDWPSGIIIVLDRNTLRNNNIVRPVDYWGPEVKQMGKSEMEERLFSDKPYLENAIKYIKEFHVLAKPNDNFNKRSGPDYRKLFIAAKKNKIPIYFYDDRDAWKLQNRYKSVKIPADFVKPQKRTPRITRPQRKYLKTYVELYYKSKTDDLSDAAKTLSYNIRRYSLDRNAVFLADLHNSKSKPELGISAIVRIMKKEGLSTPIEFLDMLTNKWEKIARSE